MTHASAGVATAPVSKVTTLAELPARVASYGKVVAVRRCGERDAPSWSSREYADDIVALATALGTLGVERGDRVALMSESRPEWGIADLGILSIGAVTVPVYPTLSPPQTRYILEDSGARVAIVSDEAQLAKLQQVRHLLPGLQAIVTFATSTAAGPSVISLQDGLERGRAALSRPDARQTMEDSIRRVAADDLATIIYTSGTTGDPKGAMLTHRNLLSNLEATLQVLPISADDDALSFLPGVTSISSQALAEQFHLNAAQIRKDLACFGDFGVRGVGYYVKDLKRHLRQILGLDRRIRVAIMGAGNLGLALADYPGFRQEGFEIVALFDNQSNKIGDASRSGVRIHDVRDLKRMVKRDRLDIAVIAVPAHAAQAVVDVVVAAGIKAILNFSPGTIRVPAGVKLKSVDLTISLESLSFFLASGDAADEEEPNA